MTGQIFANEMKCYFNLRKPKECRPTNINMVTSINHKQVKLATGVKIYPNQWNMKKQEAYISIRLTELDNINNTVVNNKIRELKDCFVEFKEYLCDHPDEIENSVSLLKRYIYKDKMKKENDNDATAWLLREMAHKRNTESTLNIYRGHIKGFEKFLKEKNIYPIAFKDINLALMKEYENYLFKEVVDAQNGKTMKTRTVGDKVHTLIGIIKWAEAYSLIDTKDAKLDRYTKPKSNEGDDNEIYLSEEDLQKMYDLPLTGVDEEVRDLFVLQCWTGQRFSDINKLQNGILRDVENGKVLEIIQKKTIARVSIPLLPIALEILNKYDYKLPSVSQRNMLTKIKEIGKKAGITELHQVVEQRGSDRTTYKIERYKLMGTHTARRSYISNMLKKGYDSHVLMKITGHKTESAFKTYAKLNSADAANTVLAKEANREEPQAKQENKSTQKIPFLDYLFAESTLLKLRDMKKEGIDIDHLPEKQDAIRTIMNIKTIDHAKECICNAPNIDETKLHDRTKEIGNIIWDIAKYDSNPTLYQIFEKKVLELNISGITTKVTDSDVLNMLFDQEMRDEEEDMLTGYHD